jgi:hypothetical protein
MGGKDNLVLWIVSETLTDGSEVFNVILNGFPYNCPTESDAVMLVEGIKELMERHTSFVEVGTTW